MKYKHRFMKSAALAMGGAVLLAACGGAQGAETTAAGDCTLGNGAVGLAIGGRANMPTISGTPQFAAVVKSAVANQSHLTVYETSGTPSQVFDASLQLASANDAAREDERTKQIKGIEAALLGVEAQSPEANPLKALGLAADAVRANGSGGTVLLADSGLSTTPPLDYRQSGMLLAEGDDLAQQAKKSGELPDLTGMTVVLTGIGDTAAPQQPLDNATKRRLQSQWVSMAQAAGAACVSLDPMPMAGPPKSAAPAVSAVQPPAPTTFDIDEPVHLRSDVLAFKVNSAELVDPAESKAALQPLAAALSSASGRILLTGTTAMDGTREYRMRLSLDRANATKNLLAEMGVDADRIDVKGVGTEHPSHIEDIGPGGQLLPGPAAKNRSVIVEVQ